MKAAKEQRLAEANAVIQTVSELGRRFFYNRINDRVAKLEVNSRGLIRLRDDYSGKMVYVYRGGSWPGFSHGGTLRSLVEALRDYVRFGRPVPRGHFGPWRDGYEMWGYPPADMQTLRERLFQMPAVARPNIEREQNHALIEFYGRWRLNGDWLVCQGCKRPLIASRDGEALNHKDRCKNSESLHPWTELRSLISPKE